MKISALIITLNEESNIRRCLDSIKWCDEIIIVDAFSIDNTINIAKEYTDKIIQIDAGFGESRQVALDNCTGDWILSIDADEVITESLSNEILQVINKDYDAYKIPSKLLVMNKWHQYPIDKSPDVKLLRKNKAVLVNTRVGEHYETTGNIGKLKNIYLHYQNETIAERDVKINRYSTLGAKDRYDVDNRFRLYNMFNRPIRMFVYDYILLGQAKFGLRGFIYSIMKGYQEFLKQIKLFEIENVK